MIYGSSKEISLPRFDEAARYNPGRDSSAIPRVSRASDKIPEIGSDIRLSASKTSTDFGEKLTIELSEAKSFRV
ncbi:hypothetical protein EVAR_34527_1 [Eumeta japonica]|uniref:Uncharacterized protein n=1 Tax=Eumeta variegata TaxID=151549 RepID=A0A4C1X8E4_EUMVA|nr:hypothetical protein EVAR_34527_1 [Eumeta japonica]